MAVGFGYGNQPSPGDGGLGSGAGGSDLGLSSHIPGHFRSILARGSASGEDYNAFQHHQRVINLQRQHQQQQEQQAEDRAAASFVAYETGGGIGLLRTGLDHHHHHHHHQEKSSIVDHGASPWGAPPGSNPVRELVVGRGIDVVPLAERLVDVDTGKNPLHLLQIPHEPQQQPGQAAPNPSPVAHTAQEQQQVALQQGQQQPTDSSSSRPHGRGHQPGGATCKECGNQAKKDCQFQRCRTCCKSRGYDCVTHVKSTWVPAAKRRERQALEAAAMAAGQPRPRSKRTRSLALQSVASGVAAQGGGALGSMNISGAVGNPNLLALPGSSSSPRSSDLPATGSFRSGMLPPEVRAHALFKCVKVTGIEDGENEYAYQATVKIGGHVFKGVLYDQGVDTTPAPIASLADLQLGAARSLPPSSGGYLDPSQIYGSGTLLGALR